MKEIHLDFEINVFIFCIIYSLAGKCNRVFTGVVLKHSKGIRSFTETADVYFGQLTNQQIQEYVDSGEPL